MSRTSLILVELTWNQIKIKLYEDSYFCKKCFKNNMIKHDQHKIEQNKNT